MITICTMRDMVAIRARCTHRDPQTGDLWGEDIPVGKKPTEYGCWVRADSVVIDWDE